MILPSSFVKFYHHMVTLSGQYIYKNMTSFNGLSTKVGTFQALVVYAIFFFNYMYILIYLPPPPPFIGWIIKTNWLSYYIVCFLLEYLDFFLGRELSQSIYVTFNALVDTMGSGTSKADSCMQVQNRNILILGKIRIFKIGQQTQKFPPDGQGL